MGFTTMFLQLDFLTQSELLFIAAITFCFCVAHIFTEIAVYLTTKGSNGNDNTHGQKQNN